MPQFTYHLSEHLFIKMKTFNVGNQAFTGCHYVLDVCQGIKIHQRPRPCPQGAHDSEKGSETSVVIAVTRLCTGS